MSVIPSSDTTPPATPANLQVVSSSVANIALAWAAVTGDPTMYGYEVLRSSTSGGPYATIATTTNNAYTDSAVIANATYFYVVRAIDQSYNRSGLSNEVSGVAKVRKINLTFNVTVPSTTDGTGFFVHIAGTLNLLDGNLPAWDPGATALTRVDDTHWTIALTGNEGVQLQYKYALGSWDYVEKGAVCDEIANRQTNPDLRNHRQPNRIRHRPKLAQRSPLRPIILLCYKCDSSFAIQVPAPETVNHRVTHPVSGSLNWPV